jgi:hypothetical protein
VKQHTVLPRCYYTHSHAGPWFSKAGPPCTTTHKIVIDGPQASILNPSVDSETRAAIDWLVWWPSCNSRASINGKKPVALLHLRSAAEPAGRSGQPAPRDSPETWPDRAGRWPAPLEGRDGDEAVMLVETLAAATPKITRPCNAITAPRFCTWEPAPGAAWEFRRHKYFRGNGARNRSFTAREALISVVLALFHKPKDFFYVYYFLFKRFIKILFILL